MTDGAELMRGARMSLASRAAVARERVRGLPGGIVVWRVGVTVTGLLVIGVGIVLLPLPGPGWLVIFAGLGLLATEYPWAGRLLRRLQAVVARWTRWAAGRRAYVQVVLALVGVLFLVAVAAAGWYVARLV